MVKNDYCSKHNVINQRKSAVQETKSCDLYPFNFKWIRILACEHQWTTEKWYFVVQVGEYNGKSRSLMNWYRTEVHCHSKKKFRNGETYCACTLIIKKKTSIVLNDGVKCLDQNIDTYFKIDRNGCPNHINLSNDLEEKKIWTMHFCKLRLSS